MKIVICDYKTDLARDIGYEARRLREYLRDAEIVVYEYKDENKRELIELLRDADAVITTYVTFDREILSQCEKLKCIALNMMAHNIVDLDAASEFGVMVCPAAEYCTTEVAEHTMALIFALCRGLRRYMTDIERHIWDYTGAAPLERISGKTLTIFGFGRIGRAVAARAQAMGLRVQVVSHSLWQEDADKLGVKLVDWETAMRTSDIISNHLQMNAQNAGYFDLEKFRYAEERKPYFINTGRGGTVDEDALAEALDRGFLRGAGLDVLSSENVDFSKLKLLGRENVIITPHAAFYSEQSAQALQNISCDSVIGALTGDYNKISMIANRMDLNLQ